MGKGAGRVARARAAGLAGPAAGCVAAAAVLAASAGPALAASPLEGRYSDPLHPGCTRTVSVTAGKVTGADGAGSDGACKAGEPVKEWALAATFAKDGQSMKVDFSPKGGPKDVTGTWNGKDGITFPDGNTWAKLESTNLDTKAYPSKAERSTDLGKGGWSVDRLTKRMGGFY